MPRSTITSKNQTTVPRQVRQELGVSSGDVLVWEIAGSEARVRPASRGFLELRGSINVGPGDPVEDVRRARALRGTTRW